MLRPMLGVSNLPPPPTRDLKSTEKTNFLTLNDRESVPTVYGVLWIVVDDNEEDYRFARLTTGLVDKYRSRGE